MEFDLAAMSSADCYKIVSASITPRPIAWISTMSKKGDCNLAPYSFFNMVSADPPLLVFGLMRKSDGTHKDTAANILSTGEFVVNMVCEDDAEAMNFSCIDAPPGFDEIAATGLKTAPATRVRPPRIASAPVSMECRLFQATETPGTTVVLGQIVTLHIGDEFIDAERLHVDAPAMQLIARMHGAGWYTRSTDRFQLARPTYEEWHAEQKVSRESDSFAT